jgi:hypothetical protein
MSGNDAFPDHVFHALGVPPHIFEKKIGGAVTVIEKRPEGGPITLMTAGVSNLATHSGEAVELAVEVLDGQQGAGFIALRIVCDDIAQNRRVPPVGAPWRNSEPFLTGTAISAIVATGSRWGASFDEVRAEDGTVVGHVRTLRLLTDAEAGVVATEGFDALRAQVGSVEALLDVERDDVGAPRGVPDNTPVILSKMHADHPPRWVTYAGRSLQSVTGYESEAYMDDSSNHEIWPLSKFVERFPFIEGFLGLARVGETARFDDDSGVYKIEAD